MASPSALLQEALGGDYDAGGRGRSMFVRFLFAMHDWKHGTAAISELIIAPNESILMDGPFSWKLGQ
jgi:hypothetical protein